MQLILNLKCISVIDCGPPPEVYGARFNVTGDKYRHNATYECVLGKNYTGGAGELMCGYNLTWDGDNITCAG